MDGMLLGRLYFEMTCAAAADSDIIHACINKLFYPNTYANLHLL